MLEVPPSILVVCVWPGAAASDVLFGVESPGKFEDGALLPDVALPVDATWPVPKLPLEALFVGAGLKLIPPVLDLSLLPNMLVPGLLRAPVPLNNEGPEVEGVLPKRLELVEAVAF